MAELFPIGIEEQIACVERELRLRERVYARRVGDKKMTRAQAEKEIAAMQAVLETLQKVKRGEA